MATLKPSDTRGMYSWWWHSHISPKNSKWLQENLTDMDAKVKAMIKLIEEDADSFARRAEMYYKKRPELMKLVEEFYRAYRALAERYDHATGVIRQAHRTMVETFPNQVPLLFGDDSPAGSASNADPRTLEMSTPVHAFSEPDDLQKGSSGLLSSYSQDVKRNGTSSEESNFLLRRKGLKQFNDGVRKSLDFNEAEEKEQTGQSNKSHGLPQVLSDSEKVDESEEILTLRKALAQLEAEKEASLIQYQQGLSRLSALELEIARIQEDSREHSERAGKAEAEAQNLKEALSKMEAEKESNLFQYHQCLDRISDLENLLSHSQEDVMELNERAYKSETEVQSLKDDLAKVATEKDAALDKYMQSLETISKLENELKYAEEDGRNFKERAERAETEVEMLKETLSRLATEKEAAALQYKQFLETISTLENKLACAQEEAQRLNIEIDNGVAKLKSAEEQCLLLEKSNQSLHSELESLLLKVGTQNEELAEKQQELGRLWTCIQEERLRFVEAETAFQTLQHLHSQTQEELRSVASELQNRVQTLRDTETHNHNLQEEILKAKEEIKTLADINISSAMSIKEMQNEISGLRETKGKLEEEVELRVDQRNALQQEIYCLRKELNDLNKKHISILDQVNALGLDPKCLESSVKELQDENSNLKESIQREQSEKSALLEKLEILEDLLEKNSVLENSLSDLNAELDAVRGKIKSLEESYQALLGEKSNLLDEKATLMTELQVLNKNLEKLSMKNTVLENSLSDTRDELQVLKTKSKSLEDSCQLLVDEKAGLASEKDAMISQLETTMKQLEELEKRYADLGEKYSILEKEKESALNKVEGLWVTLDAERQEHAYFVELKKTQLAGMESEMQFLQEECQWRKREFDEELDKALDSNIEIFILQSSARDLEEKHGLLLTKYQKLLETSILSKNTISDLENRNNQQQQEVKSLFGQATYLRKGMCQLLEALDIVIDHDCKDQIQQDQKHINCLLRKLADTRTSFHKTEDESQQWALELSILIIVLGQLKIEAEALELEKEIIHQRLKKRTEELSTLQMEAMKLHEMNQGLRSKLREKEQNEKELTTQVGNLQGDYQDLQIENSKILEEKMSLSKELLLLEGKNHILEEEYGIICGELFYLDHLCQIFKNCINEKSLEFTRLVEDLDKLHGLNGDLKGSLSLTERTLHKVQMENLNLRETLQKSDNELRRVSTVRDQLSQEVEDGKNILSEKNMILDMAEQKLSLMEMEKSELLHTVENLRSENDEVRMTIDNKENQILKLSADNSRLITENSGLGEVNQLLEIELHQLRKEHGETKAREESLHYELCKRIDETDKWEAEGCALFGELQIFNLYQVLYEQKIHELTEACQSFTYESASKDLEIELLKQRVSTVDGENGSLRNQLAAYGHAVASLKECILSLEKYTYSHGKFQTSETGEMEDAEVAIELRESPLNNNENPPAPDALLDLQYLQTRVQAIEKAVVDAEQVAAKENSNMSSKLQAAMKELEELKSESTRHRRNLKQTSEISEAENGLLTKDIMLDQISSSSSYRSETVKTENQNLKVSETTDQDCRNDLSVSKGQKAVTRSIEKDDYFHQVKSLKKYRGEHPTSDALVEKELGVDKLEISKRSMEPPQEGNKRKVLERLNSDVQKLVNLQIVVQDLKRKLKITEKNQRGKAVLQCDTLNEQLEEAEEAIVKLFDLNGKLMKNFEHSSFSSDANFEIESEENENARRRKVSEQGRKISERIGRLQLEIQKIQFVLLKLDDEKEKSKGTSRFLDTKRRVLLRDYLYGGIRPNHRRKKAPFCACVQPRTQGD